MSEWAEDWPLVRLGDLAAAEPNAITDGPFGSNLKSADYVENGPVRVIRLGNIGVGEFREDDVAFVSEEKFRTLEKHEARAGDLVIAALAEPVGRAAIVPASIGRAIVKADCIRFRAGSRIESRFLLHALNSPLGLKQTEEAAHGIGRLRVNLGEVRDLPIPMPPLDEQRRIVAKLDALRARSRRAKDALDAVPALLDRLRQSILAAAFRGDLTADWREQNPDVEPIEAVLARVIVPLSNTGRAATITEIEGDAALAVGMSERDPPRGWKWVPLTSVAKLESGHTPSRGHSEWWGGEVPWIAIPDARDHHGLVIDETATTTNADGLANSAARLLPAGTVCLSRTASVGYVTIMGRPMATSQDFANWVCSEAVVPEWLMYLFLAEANALLRFAHGAIHSTIYFPELKALHVCLPPVDEQRAIVEAVKVRLAGVERMDAATDCARVAHGSLDAAVLAAAFRGELLDRQSAAYPGDQERP